MIKQEIMKKLEERKASQAVSKNKMPPKGPHKKRRTSKTGALYLHNIQLAQPHFNLFPALRVQSRFAAPARRPVLILPKLRASSVQKFEEEFPEEISSPLNIELPSLMKQKSKSYNNLDDSRLHENFMDLKKNFTKACDLAKHWLNIIGLKLVTMVKE